MVSTVVKFSKKKSGLLFASGNWFHTQTVATLAILLLVPAVACQSVEKIGFWSNIDSNIPSNKDSETVTTGAETESATSSKTALDTEDTNTGTAAADTEDTEDTEDTNTDASTAEDTNTTDTDSADTGTQTGQDTDSKYFRVPFAPVFSPEDPFQLLVGADKNVLGLPGGWFAYGYFFAPGTLNQPYFDWDGNICMKGDVPQWSGSPSEIPVAGLGVSLCYDPKQSFISYSIEDCPYLSETQEIALVGASFYVEGHDVPDEVKLQIRWLWLTIRSDIDLGVDTPQDYLFDTLSDSGDVGAPPERIINIQIQVDSAVNHSTSYDFCIKDFALLVATD